MQLDQLIGKSSSADNFMPRSVARIIFGKVQVCIGFRFSRLVLIAIKGCRGLDKVQTGTEVKINCVRGILGTTIAAFIGEIENIEGCDDLVLVKVSASTEMKDFKLHPLNHIFY